jgi:hypothetical protein
MRAMWENKKCASTTGQSFSFHNAKIFFADKSDLSRERNTQGVAQFAFGPP